MYSSDHDIVSSANLPSILLLNLSLQHCIPIFEKNKIDVPRFLAMSEPTDFINIGISDATDCHRLAYFVRAVHTRLGYSYSCYSSSVHSLSTSISAPTAGLTTPTDSMFGGFATETESFLENDDHEADQQFIMRIVDAALPWLSVQPAPSLPAIPSFTKSDFITASPLGTQMPRTPSFKGKRSLRDSTISSISGSTTTTVAEPAIPSPPPPPPYEPPSRRSRSSRRTPRPTSLPAYLCSSAAPALPPPCIPSDATTHPLPPPPSSPAAEPHEMAMLKRWEKCKSMVLPREEEGREELPPYKCTVFKMGYIHMKREMDYPGVKSRWRYWRKVYAELWGTVLRIYRVAPKETENYYLPRLPFFHRWRRQYYTPLATISLGGAEAARALDYFKRPNALRLTTAEGIQMLVRLPTNIEMISWIEHLQAAINISLDLECRPMPKFITLPARGLNAPILTTRTIELERARDQRRREQGEALI
ncbi:hypothetical protein DFQ28_002315 [Apophysomyces sp. BC1034]|nr:hypothetical protein DFQ30_001048 [Apophysomyces sp. BC1015]KAG0183122.1 hypothetical protein DFQ29_009820 [Apophysomyces sp. BC1021]KAG0193951.1 hypothetical protein DFQ28_002315 [Apophysomyces sp. BC1034]